MTAAIAVVVSVTACAGLWLVVAMLDRRAERRRQDRLREWAEQEGWRS